MRTINVLAFFFIITSIIFADEWQIKKGGNNIVKFTSSTTVLDFEGITQNVDGYMYWEGKELFGDKNELYFEVDLNTVKTGIGKRDRDMRDDVLETDKWQNAYYKGSIISAEKNENNNNYSVIVDGKMFIHGIEKNLKIPGEIIIENHIMKIKTEFSIYLNDFKIEAPSLLAFIKVAQEIKLHLLLILEQARE